MWRPSARSHSAPERRCPTSWRWPRSRSPTRSSARWRRGSEMALVPSSLVPAAPHWRKAARGIGLAVASVLFLGYILAPVTWLVSSSFQTEREIISKPPHWIPHEPTVQNFSAIFGARDKVVTYETRRAADPASGGYIPSTASNLLPAIGNSFLVACA